MTKLANMGLPKIDKETRQWFYLNHTMGKESHSYRVFYWKFWDRLARQKDAKFIQMVYDKQDELRAKREKVLADVVSKIVLKKERNEYEIAEELFDAPVDEQAEYVTEEVSEVPEQEMEIYRQEVPVWKPKFF